MREIVLAPRLPRRQLPLDRAARAGDAAADQRLQPAGDQRDRAATSGTTSRRSRTRTCRRSARSRCTTRSPASRRPTTMPAGGRGYTRPPSLISLWSTAPFLLNNSVGAVRRRARRSTRACASFDDSIEQMLWPEKRERDSVLGAKVPGTIDRTTERSHVTDPERLRPGSAAAAAGHAASLAARGSSATATTSSLGPIPQGMPVEPAVQPGAARRERRPRRQGCSTSQDRRRSWSSSSSTLASAPAGASDEELRAALRQPGRADAGAEQVPRLRRQPRPLLRHRRVQPAGRPQRRREGVRHASPS